MSGHWALPLSFQERILTSFDFHLESSVHPLAWHPVLWLWWMGIEASHQGIMSDGASLIPRKLSSSVKASTGRLHSLSLPALLCLMPWCLMVKMEKKIFNMVPIRLPLSSLWCIPPLCVHGFIIGIPSLNHRNQFCLLSVCVGKLARQPFAYATAQNHYCSSS